MSKLEKTASTEAPPPGGGVFIRCTKCEGMFPFHAQYLSEIEVESWLCEDCLEGQQEIFRGDIGTPYKDWVIRLQGGRRTIHWWSWPFVVTVVGEPKSEGYLLDWWVTAENTSTQQPVLVTRASLGINSESIEDLESNLQFLWEDSIHALAVISLENGGFGSSLNPLSLDYTKAIREEIVSNHLKTHDEMWDQVGNGKRRKVLLTAGWHNLIRQFGLKQTQQLIANHERAKAIGETLKGKESDWSKPSTAHINKRLYEARKQGLLSLPNAHLQERSNERQREKRKTGNENKRRN